MLGCLIPTSEYMRLYKTRPKTLFSSLTLIMIIFLAILIGTFHLGNKILTTFAAIGFGHTLYALLSINMYQLVNNQTKIMPIALTLASASSTVVTGFGDYVHYMNRDVTAWIYSCEGFIGVLVFVASILQVFTVKFV